MTRIFRCNLPIGEEAEHVGIEVHDRAEGVTLKQGVGAVKGASGIGGAVRSFQLRANVATRTIMAPEHRPIDIVSGFVGGVFFVWLLRRA